MAILLKRGHYERNLHFMQEALVKVLPYFFGISTS